MSKGKLIAIIIAVSCIVLGSGLICFTIVVNEFDFEKFNTMDFVENSYVIEDEVRSINVDGVECDVKIFVSEDEKVKVQTKESDKIITSIDVEAGTMTLKRVDKRKWYERISIWWGEDLHITVYLPEAEYEDIILKTASGDIKVEEKVLALDADIKSTSGSISYFGEVINDINIETTSGDIKLKSTVSNGMTIKSVSGEIELEQCENSNSLNVKTTSGDIKFSELEADDIIIKTTSGDVKGTLTSDKLFIIDTNSGDVKVPESKGTYTCNIDTTSGDIDIKIN